MAERRPGVEAGRRTDRWQVFGLPGMRGPEGQRSYRPPLPSPEGPVRSRRMWLSFPVTAAGQSRNHTGFPLASASLESPQNQLRATPYVGYPARSSTTCRTGVSLRCLPVKLARRAEAHVPIGIYGPQRAEPGAPREGIVG